MFHRRRSSIFGRDRNRDDTIGMYFKHVSAIFFVKKITRTVPARLPRSSRQNRPPPTSTDLHRPPPTSTRVGRKYPPRAALPVARARGSRLAPPRPPRYTPTTELPDGNGSRDAAPGRAKETVPESGAAPSGSQGETTPAVSPRRGGRRGGPHPRIALRGSGATAHLPGAAAAVRAFGPVRAVRAVRITDNRNRC